MKPEPGDYLASARKELEVAEYLLEGRHFGPAYSRAYYAVFYAASAALESLQERPKTHKGTAARFHQRVIIEGGFDLEIGGLLSRMATVRLTSDYGFMPPTPESTVSGIEAARRFADAIEAWLGARPLES